MNQATRKVEIAVSRTVHAPYAKVEESFRIGAHDLVKAAFANLAGDDLNGIEASLHLRHFRALCLPARLEFETPHDGTRKNVIHLRWRARYLPKFFPVMEADLSLRPTTGESTEVVLTGTYTPPFGFVGLIGDQLVGISAARSTVEQFLADIGPVIEKDARK